MIKLYFSAFSPYCRKVRMALEFKKLNYEIVDSNDVAKINAWNPRAEVPVLTDGEITLRNSATILEYLDKVYAQHPVFPSNPAAFALAKEWELVADTMIDPIITNMSLWKWANMNPKPEGLDEAARKAIDPIYDRLNQQLEGSEFIVGELSAADFAVYPHITGANFVDLPFDPGKHSNISAWLKRVKATELGRIDMKAILDFWKNLSAQEVDRDRINWGTYRLEWFLANGFHEWFLNEVREDKVLWSVGPKNNALNSPAAKANA
ncbi:MAG: glutathione S-transferase family protein [Aquisalinus sp.]|nr:glutathione S-transferase family protein [Aquisalinus sp.]